MRRVLPFALVVAAIGACSFPEATYSSDGGVTQGDDSGGSSGSSSGTGSGSGSGSGTDASSGSGSGSGSGGPDGSSGSDAPSDHTTSGDSPGDVVTTDTSSSSSGGDGPIDCDQDNDTFKGPQCGGNDCCDTDSNAHPNQMGFFTTQDACKSWDYNCDTTIEYEFPQSIPCSGTPTLGCNGGPGFLGAEDCGQQGPYGSCQPNGAVQCSLKQTGTDTQGCQ